MAEIVISVASKVAEYLVAPVGRQCGYVVFTDSYVRQLKDELEKLDNARQRVQHSVDDALNDMKLIEADVQTWAKDAETVSNEAHDVLENDGRAKKTCFRGWLPNPKGRYCLGRDARKTAQAIQELIPQGKFKRVYYERARPALVGGAAEVNSSACDGGDTIQELIPLGQFENPLPGLVGGAPDMNLLAGGGGDTITDSRASIFQDIMKALHDEKLKVVGVYGPGGVGKTTLLKKVEEKLRKEGRPFQMIVKAEVLQTPDLNNIQGQIADALKLDLKDKQSQQGRRDHLLQRLQQDPSEKILIILDDLWDKLDLNAVGIPFGDESRGCKLLLTSRFSDVLQQKMLADQTFRLEGLNDGEAFQLFEKTVGDKLKDEELRRIAPKIVKKLAGLPLLIISVASTLKYSHVSAWNKALRKIDESDIKTIVKLSYDHLNSEDAKSLFLLCGLIGGTIRVETLFVLGMGLGLFEECNETMQDSRDELNIALDRLRSICLLQDGGDDKENVTIHDLYSEVVVSTPFRDRNSLMMNNNYGFWLKEKLEKCWAICLADVGKDRLTELMKCQFPNLKILMLSQDWHWMREHQHDVEECWRLQDFIYMKELRVLYLRSMHISSFSSSIGILGSLHSLYLDDCDVEDVKILGKLKALQILSFAKSAISRLPKEIGELTNLRSLNLSNCNRLETIEPGVLEGLIKLEELYMKSSFDQWMGTDEIPSESCNARLAELKSLTRLTTLEISIPNPTILFKDGDLPFGNLIKFWFNIGNVNGRVFQVRTMKLKLEGCDSFLLKDWVQETLQKTQYLHLDGLREFKKNAHELCVRGFTQLKHLDIQNSPSIKYIASSSSDLPIAFTMLESLFLENLINLEKLCNGLVAPDCFSKLKVMRIIKCCKLENLWFQSKMQRLVHLEEIQICECDSLQAIITYDARKVEATANDIVELPDVRHLELRKLSKMTSFCTGAKGAPIQVSLPRLESLVIDGLLGLEKILYSEPSFKYNNLKSLKIEESKLTSIIPKDWLLKLPNLESMAIAGTPFVEVVFDLEELKVLEEVKILSQLSTLALSKLPNLRCMWKQDVQLQGISILQNLKKLSIKNTGLSFLFPFSVAKCLREIRQIEVKNCPNMKAVIVDEEGRDDGTDGILEFPSLKRLSISCCPTKKFFSYPPGEKESIVTTSDSKDTYFDSFFDQKISLPSLEKLILHSLRSPRHACVRLSLAMARRGIRHSELPKSSSDKLANLTSEQDFQSQGMSIFRNLKVLFIKKTGLSFLFSVSMAKCLREIREIEVQDCPNMNAMIVDEEGRDDGTYDIIEFPLLEQLLISRCPMEKFFSYPHGKKESITIASDSQDTYSDSFLDQKISLPSLKELILHSLGSSRRDCVRLGLAMDRRGIWHNELPKSSFDKLANLTPKQDLQSQGISIFRHLNMLYINNTGLSFLFSVSVAKCLREIRKIEVEDCPNMNAVIVDEEGRDDGIDDIIEFPLLERLSISRCPTRKFLYRHGKKESITTTLDSKDTYSDSFFNQKISLPSLKELILHSLGSSRRDYVRLGLAMARRGIWHSELPKSSDKLTNLTPKHDLQSQGMLIFQNLEVLSINNTGLSFLFSVSVAKCLREIRKIEVEDCPNMDAVIVDEEGRDDGTDDTIEFPLLKRLSISCCPMEKFFSYHHGKKELITTTSDSKDTYSDSFFNQKISLPSLKKLKMNSVGSLTRIWHGELPKSSFDKLAKFTCKKCSNLLDVFPSTIMGRLHNLIKVKVSKCPSLESLFDFGSLDSCMEQTIELLRELKEVDVVSCPSLESLFNWGPLDSSTKHKIVLLPKLEEVGVSGAGRLRHVVMSDSQTILGFPSLKLVHVHNCSELRYLFPNYTATTLEKLDVLKIFKCKQMKEVVPKGEGGRSKAEGMSFPSLTNLAIWRCPNFRAFIWSPTSAVGQPGEMIEENDELPRPLFNDMVRFPNLEKLYIGGVQCKELWSNQISDDSFCKLESLILNDCDNLQHIAPSHMWKRLQDCLETLEVKSCCSIEIIYESDGKVAKSGNLRTLNLRDLDNLRHIWWYDSLPIIPFPNLRYVKAVRCSRLDMLFTTFTAKFLRQIEKLVVGSCEDMVLIAGHEECEEVTGKTITFSGLTTLRLYNLPKFESFLPEKYFAKFPSLDVSSRTEPDQGNRSVEESEGEIEELDSEIEFDSKIDEESEGEIEFDSEIDEESEGEIEELDSEIDGESEGEIEEFDNEIDEESEWEIEEFDSEIDKESEGE